MPRLFNSLHNPLKHSSSCLKYYIQWFVYFGTFRSVPPSSMPYNYSTAGSRCPSCLLSNNLLRYHNFMKNHFLLLKRSITKRYTANKILVFIVDHNLERTRLACQPSYDARNGKQVIKGKSSILSLGHLVREEKEG